LYIIQEIMWNVLYVMQLNDTNVDWITWLLVFSFIKENTLTVTNKIHNQQ